MDNLPIPYSDYLYIAPIEKKTALGLQTMQTIGEVLATGNAVSLQTKVGDFVAFELWDKPEFLNLEGKSCHFVRERDVICKVPESWTKK